MLKKLNTSLSLYYFNNSIKQLAKKSQNDKLIGLESSSYGSLKGISQQKRRQSLQARKRYKQTLPSTQMKMFASEHLCDVTLYMKHNQWKSQYIYSLLNYQKLGFTPVSDYSYLKTAAKYFQVTEKQESERFPIMKFSIPLQEASVLHGVQQIIDFLNEKQLFRFQVQGDQSLSQTVQKYVNQNVVPHLQALFWHPRLTFQSTFHTNISSYNKNNMSYKIIDIFYKNFMGVFVKVTKNLIKIMQNKTLYMQSKQNLEKALKQLVIMLQNKQFLGGAKPSHLDFYLLAVLNTKNSSKHFQQFLKKDVGGQFMKWLIRMRSLTKYDKERVTFL